MANAIQKNSIVVLKNYLARDDIQKRLMEMLGKRAGAFTNSIINVTLNSSKLQKCTQESVISAAMVAASMNLPIDPALGQAAIVPYGEHAGFQIMYKGLVQLCIRSGKYATINCSEIYGDELKSHNPITGEIEFNNPESYKQRYQDNRDKFVVGHYAYFKLLSGFEKSDYMTNKEALAHGKKYSKAYQYDIRKKKKTCPWSTDPVSMCNKTVLIRLLNKYGVKSIEMQDAIIADSHSFEKSQVSAQEMIDGEAGTVIVDAKDLKVKTKPKAKTPPEDMSRANSEDDNWMEELDVS